MNTLDLLEAADFLLMNAEVLRRKACKGDVPGRKEPGTGEINYLNVFKSIHALGYKGILGMEHGWTKPGIDGMVEGFAQYRKADSWT